MSPKRHQGVETARRRRLAIGQRSRERTGGLRISERLARLALKMTLRYAVFPRRLAIKDGETVEVYDTGHHRIFGVAQAQSADQPLTFTSQDGLVRVKGLPKVSDDVR